MKRLAVIPARGGSKRIPRKNLVDFGGRPMIEWTIEAAIGSGRFDRVLVSTDDSEIAKVAQRAGAEAVARERFADDHTPVSRVTHDLVTAPGDSGSEIASDFDLVVQLLPSCPLRRAADVRDALDAFADRGARFQISCAAYGWRNPWWAHRVDGDGRAEPLFPEALDGRSQDLEPIYCPSGAIWVAQTAAFVSSGTFYGPGYTFHPLDGRRAIDIDDPADLALARALLTSSPHDGRRPSREA